MQRNGLVSALIGGVLASLLVSYSAADSIREGCNQLDSISYVPHPVSDNIVELSSEDSELFGIVLSQSFVGEPVGAGAWPLLHIVDGEGSNHCYLVHSGNSDDEFPSGFNSVRIDRSFYRYNQMEDRFEVFIPVTGYPFADGEDYTARFIEVSIGTDLKPHIVQ